MNNLEYIKEGIFLTSEYPFSPLIKPYFKDFSDDKYKDYLAHCLYTGGDNNFNLIACTLTGGEFDLDMNDGFINYLKKYKPQTFDDTLFLLDIYTTLFVQQRQQDIDDFIVSRYCKPNSPIDKILESFLSESRGILLWTYQLEKICGLINITIEDRIKLRKDLNAKKVPAWKVFEDFNLDEGRTLRDFVEERMVLGYTKWPNIQGAKVLYELIIDNKKKAF